MQVAPLRLDLFLAINIPTSMLVVTVVVEAGLPNPISIAGDLY